MAKTNALSTLSPDQLKNCLGSGSFGTVWSVKHPENGEEVALKEIADVFATTSRSKMIFRELKILNHLQHVNVISVLDVAKPDGLEHFHKVCIATELMYADLHRVTRSKQTFTAINIQLIFYQIVRGLRYIHSAKIIHRDIKPGNVLVKRNWAVKICDFGMARRETPPRSRRRMTLDVSTYYYRAPELCLYAKRYSTAVDMWAAACLLAELHSRDFLFPTDQLRTPVELYRKIVSLLGTPSPKEIGYAEANVKRQVSKWSHQEPKLHTLRDISPFATEEVVDLLSKLLRYDPSSRLKATEVLKHSFLDRGRKMYHSCLCRCCRTPPSGLRLHVMNLEPAASQDFDDKWESEIISVEVAKQEMFKYLNEQKRIQKNFSLSTNFSPRLQPLLYTISLIR